MLIDDVTSTASAGWNSGSSQTEAAGGFAQMLDQLRDEETGALSQSRLQEYLAQKEDLMDRASDHFCASPGDGAEFQGREVLGYDADGLPVTRLDPDELSENFKQQLERAAKWGQDLDDLQLIALPEPQFDGLDHTGTVLKVGVAMPLTGVLQKGPSNALRFDTLAPLGA